MTTSVDEKSVCKVSVRAYYIYTYIWIYMGGTWGRSVVRQSVDSCLRWRESSTPGHNAECRAHVLTTYLPNLPTYLPIYLTYLPTRPPAHPSTVDRRIRRCCRRHKFTVISPVMTATAAAHSPLL